MTKMQRGFEMWTAIKKKMLKILLERPIKCQQDTEFRSSWRRLVPSILESFY